MKFFLILALTVVGAFAAPKVQDDESVVEKITEVVNQILDAIPEPLLDIHDETASLDLGFETLDFTFTNVVLSGIKSAEITTLDFDEDTGRLDYVFTLGSVTANVEFDLVLAGILDAVNHPVVEVDLTNLKITGYAIIDSSVSPRQVTDLDLLLVLEDSKVDLTGILNDDALTEKLETILNEQLTDMVNKVNTELEPIASPIVKSAINLIISLLG